MCLTIAYSKIKKQNLVLINNATYQRETVSERPIRQPLKPKQDIQKQTITQGKHKLHNKITNNKN